MNNIIFITGTNTGVGKTYFLYKLLEFLYMVEPKLKGKVIGYKLIETGVNFLPEDAYKISKINGFYLAPVYTFKYPLSPFDASYLERRKVFKYKILETLKKLSKEFLFVFVEGAGGINVPIMKNYTYLDLIKEFNLKTILVSLNKLGTINDTLLSCQAIGKYLVAIYLNKIKEKEANMDYSKQTNLRTILLFLKNKYKLFPFISEDIKEIGKYLLRTFIKTKEI